MGFISEKWQTWTVDKGVRIIGYFWLFRIEDLNLEFFMIRGREKRESNEEKKEKILNKYKSLTLY